MALHGAPETEDAWGSRQRYRSDEGSIWAISRDALIALKVLAGRPQDLADVQRLTEQDR